MSSTAEVATVDTAVKTAGLERGIDWTGAFWVASGVPPLVLFSIGAVAATVGELSWVIWTASIAMGFIQSFTYAEIAGLFPNKAGGTSIYGAMAWVRYGKLVAPISVWCNWFAWSPVQATGSEFVPKMELIAFHRRLSSRPVQRRDQVRLLLGFREHPPPRPRVRQRPDQQVRYERNRDKCGESNEHACDPSIRCVS